MHKYCTYLSNLFPCSLITPKFTQNFWCFHQNLRHLTVDLSFTLGRCCLWRKGKREEEGEERGGRGRREKKMGEAKRKRKERDVREGRGGRTEKGGRRVEE